MEFAEGGSLYSGNGSFVQIVLLVVCKLPTGTSNYILHL